MLFYDLGRMAKRLLWFYVVLFAIQFFLGRTLSVFIPPLVSFGGPFSLYFPLLILAAMATVAVNFGLFNKDYLGKNAVLINMLPIRPWRKILSKLAWGYIFILCFFYLFTLMTFWNMTVYVRPYIITYGFVFLLSGYTAMSIVKGFGKWYHILAGIIIINAVCVVVSIGTYFLFGEYFVPFAHAVLAVMLFIVCGYNMEK